MFGVEICHHDLNTGNRYFDIVLTSVQLDTGERRSSSLQYSLESCTLDHWEGFPDVQKDYERLKMDYWLCLPKNMSYNIRGKYASEFSQTLQVAVKKCSNSSNQQRICADEGQIQEYFEEQGTFFFTIYYINSLINPTSSQYLTHYLQDNNYIIFSTTLRAQGILFMEQYTITTDQSIFPFSSSHQDHGGIVTELALKNPYEVTNDVYCSFSFFKSGISRTHQRNFQKLDYILSSFGGLFGTIAILLFIVNAYNGNSFQITLGAYLFHSKNQNQGNILKKYNFLSFLIQGVYSLLNSIGCSPNWKTVREYFNCKQQMTKQLDVLYLLKRVFFLQRTMNIIFQEHQLKGLHLQQKMTLQQAKRIRKNFKVKRKIISSNQFQQKINKKNQRSINLTDQSLQNFSYKIYPQQIVQGKQKRVLNDSELNDEIVTKDLKQFFKNGDKKTVQSDISIISDDSDTSDRQNEDNIISQIKKLKIQADKGNNLSKQIWSRIDQNMKNQLSDMLKKDETIQVRGSEISDELSEQYEGVNYKKNSFSNKKIINRPMKFFDIDIEIKRLKIRNKDIKTNKFYNRIGRIGSNSQIMFCLKISQLIKVKQQNDIYFINK